MTAGLRRISSSMTYFFKVISPAILFGVVGIGIVSALSQRSPQWASVAVLGLMAFVGLAALRSYVWDVADEVFDDGDKLVVNKGDIQQTVMLRDVAEVRVTRNTNPTRLTLVLRAPGKLGAQIVFIPPNSTSSWIPFSRHPLAKELEDRIAALKKNR